MRKKITQLVVLAFVSGLFVSCMDSFTERSYYSANITKFVFDEQEVCPDIEDYAFNIDNRKDTGLIYNIDSLPYRSQVSSLYPSLTVQSSNGYIFFNDSLWEDGDSIDFSSPVVFKNTSADNEHTRVYKIHVNVHQVDPDSMLVTLKSTTFPIPSNAPFFKVLASNTTFKSFYKTSGGIKVFESKDAGYNWSPMVVTGISEEVNIASVCTYNSNYFLAATSGQLYTSVDGASWTKAGDGSKIVTLFGQLKKKYKGENDHLVGLLENSQGEICYAKSQDGLHWIAGNKIDQDFPVTDYALTKGANVTGVEFFTIAAGITSKGLLNKNVFSTETGDSWINVSSSGSTLPKRKGASIFFYDSKLVFIGGQDSSNVYHNEVFVSPDKGKNWVKAPKDWSSLVLDEGLAYSSIFVEHQEDLVNKKDREFIWILGGNVENAISVAVRRAYVNSMLFERR